MKDFQNFVGGLTVLKRTYPTWNVNLKDKAFLATWFGWFDNNTDLTDEGFIQLVNEYAKKRTYPPISPRDIFEIEIENYKKRHLPFEKVWEEATKAYLLYESQGKGFLDYVKIDCGGDAEAMEFLQSKELGYALAEWITLDAYSTKFFEKKVAETYGTFLEKKIFKNEDRPMLEKISDGTLKELE